MTASDQRFRAILLAVAFAAGISLVAFDTGLGSYGLPHDEATYHEATKRHLDWLAAWGEPGHRSREKISEHFDWRPEIVVHPTFSRWVSGASWALFHHRFGVDEIVAFRLYNALVYALTAMGVVGFALCALGRAPAVAALLLYFGMIRFFGHAHTASTDLLLACLWLFATLSFARAARDTRLRWTLGAALLSGLALATKLTGLQLVLFLAGVAAISHGRRALWSVPLLLLVPVAVFFVLDPQTWNDPAGWTAKFLGDFAARERVNFIPTFFHGERYTHRVPWYVPSVHLLVTTAPVVLALSLLAATDGTRALFRAGLRGLLEAPKRPWPLLVASGAAPLVATSLPSVPSHDLERLFLPLQPFLVLYAAYGFAVLANSRRFRRVAGRLSPRAAQLAPYAAAAVLAAPGLVQAVRYHPYQLVYFNALVGGPRGAEAFGLDVAYLKLEANARVLAALNEHVPDGKTLYANFLRFDLVEHQQKGRLKRGIRLVRTPVADYILFHARRSWMTEVELRLWAERGRPVYALRHQGVDLVALYPLRNAARPPGRRGGRRPRR